MLTSREAPGNYHSGNRKLSDLQEKLASHSGKTAHLFWTPLTIPSGSELRGLLDFVYEGNQVFISSFVLGKDLLDSLKLGTDYSPQVENDSDSIRISINNPQNNAEELFSYPGFAHDRYFSRFDSTYTTVLGWNQHNKPNFVKIGYTNGGAFYLHLAPLAFSNFFLLHKENKKYYDYALSNLPQGTELVVWEEYFRTHTNGGENGGSSSLSRAFSWIMKQPSLAWALWLLLLLFVIIYLFESKRRQKLIAVRNPTTNSSLDFVRTIGRLYYQRKDNKNLAGKMTAHFLDHVRNRYNIPTSRLDEELEKRLTYKTGMDLSIIKQIIYEIKYLADQPHVSDTELMQFNQQLEYFYKNA